MRLILRLLRLVLPSLQIDGRVLDPQIRAILAIANLKAPLESMTPQNARRQALKSQRLMPSRRVDVYDTEDFEAVSLPIRRYRATQTPSRRGLLYFHGGGFVIGGLDSHDHVCRALAVHGECEVFSVDYRLAPEHPFPAAPEDALSAWSWFRAQDFDEFLVGGDSAGGTLALVVSQHADLKPDGQLLIYPGTDRQATRDPDGPLASGFLYSVSLANYFTRQYIPDGVDLKDTRISPIFFEDVSQQPPTHLVLAGFDILYADGLAYADRLRSAGVPLSIQDETSLVHGFIALAGASDASWRAIQTAGVVLKELASRGSRVPK